jgi:hypothetical protein
MDVKDPHVACERSGSTRSYLAVSTGTNSLPPSSHRLGCRWVPLRRITGNVYASDDRVSAVGGVGAHDRGRLLRLAMARRSTPWYRAQTPSPSQPSPPRVSSFHGSRVVHGIHLQPPRPGELKIDGAGECQGQRQ